MVRYSERERERCFLPKGTFCAGFAHSPLLGEAARTRRAAPRRRRNRPRMPVGNLVGANELSGIPRESRHGRRWWGHGRGR